MPRFLLSKNLRVQLTVPVGLSLLIFFSAAVALVFFLQERANTLLKEQITHQFQANGAMVNTQLTKLGHRLAQQMDAMTHTMQQAITDSTQTALTHTAEEVQQQLKNLRHQNGTSTTLLLGQVAAPAIIARDFARLNSYIRSAHKNPAIVFAFYLDHSNKPLTRYLNRKNPKIRQQLKPGVRPDIAAIIAKGQEDPDILVVRKTISSQGEPIGSVAVGLDMSVAHKQAAAMQQQFDQLITSNSAQVAAILGQQTQQIETSLNRFLDTITKKISATTSQATQNIATSTRTMVRKTEVVLMISLTVGFLLTMAILMANGRSILRLLGGEPGAMVSLAKQIAQGDLRTNPQTTATAANSLQDALLEMAGNLRMLIGKLLSETNRLAANSDDLTHSAQNMRQEAEKSANRTAAVTQATEEMSRNLEAVSQASNQAASSVNMVAGAINEMSQAILDIAENTAKANTITKEAVAYATSSSEKINTLGQAAREISKVTEVITEISEQTNLLALNATIEAARAGEAGKGFAVVANEIKELARQTAEATFEIKEKIDSIQYSTDETVQEIGQITQVINDVNGTVTSIASAVDQQKVTTGDISTNIKEAAQGIDVANTGVLRITSTAEDIVRDLAKASRQAHGFRRISQQVEASAELLATVAGELQQQASHFNLDEASSGS